MDEKIKILLLEDAPLDAELINRQLIKGKIEFEMLIVGTKEKFRQALTDFPADVILSDHSLPSFDSHEALLMVKEAGIQIPFILITSTMTDEFAVNIMKEGAHDYIIKDRLQRLPSAVINSVETNRLQKQQNTDRDKASEDLKNLNYRLQLATKSAEMGIWDWDIINNHIKWDEGMYALYSVNSQEFGSLYEDWIAKVYPDDRIKTNEEIQSAITDKKKYDTEFRILKKGNIHTIRATGIVEWNSKGKPTRMIGINWDITKQRLAAREREQIMDELLRRNADLEQFAYIISHNLRAPVANIIGASMALNESGLSNEERESLNSGINESVMRLDMIVKDLNHILEVKGQINSTKETVYFSDLVDNINTSISNLIENSHVNITYDFSEINEMLTLKPYLYSIFYNLIVNSIKYRQKLLPGKIRIVSKLNDNKLELFFTDNGIGIDLKKNWGSVFGLYKRFHPTIPGKGMGLFMVKTQVETLGGKVSLNSVLNEGTEFKIVFDISESKP